MNFLVIFRQVADIIVPIATFIVLPVFLWYQRDRRKSRAESAIAERTVNTDVVAREAGGLGVSVAFLNEAFRMERESYQREIATLRDKVTHLESEDREKERKIEALEAAEEEKDKVIHELRRLVDDLTAKVNKLVEGTA